MGGTRDELMFATIDPEPDIIGVYFDGAQADVVHTMYEGPPLLASVVITNPSHGAIEAIEFGFSHDAEGNEAMLMVVPLPLPGIDDGETNDDHTAGDVILRFDEPVVPTYGLNIVVYAWRFRLFDDFAVYIYLSPTSVSGAATPEYVIDGDEHVATGFWLDSADFPVAMINDHVLPVEKSSFGGVKSLFR